MRAYTYYGVRAYTPQGGGEAFFCCSQGGGEAFFGCSQGGGEPFFWPAGRRFYQREPRNKCNLPNGKGTLGVACYYFYSMLLLTQNSVKLAAYMYK